MGRKKKQTIEFRFYEIPQGQSCLALLGEKWIRVYGEAINTLHFHNLFEVGYCRYGKGIVVFDEKTSDYETDMFTTIPPNYPHTTNSKEENFWEYLFFDVELVAEQMYPDNVPKQREAITILNKRADLIHADENPQMAEIIKRIMEEMRDKKPYYKETTQNLIKTLAFLIMRMHKSMDAEAPTLIERESGADIMSIKPAIEYIEENYADEIRALDLANVCNMSETHFRRSFVDIINMAPMDYLNLVRIQKACDTMRKTEHPMEIVAVECGFGNVSTFNRNFKKFLGTSPYQWKKNKENYVGKLLDYNIHALKGW
ncbi:helix-turn-helix domain-containing protein [Butyrivibrio sp. AE3004]|uniref:helix-turn-helix domain-containing protein n=1 Tax=Butyrivibrio sp. AE3004 TaxID=1506994 RepID=UPI000494CFFD|nr:AraC family transcriptional regulator [Butyrivibrio sp. AE3004]